MKKTTNLLKHIFTVGGLTALSRVLGLVREMLQSRMIGAGVEQSAFTLAFAIPNMARKLFGEGALTAAFVPIFKKEVEGGDVESARRLARAVMTMMLLILCSVATLVVMAILAIIGIGSANDWFSERTRLTLKLVCILFPYMIFICGAAFGMSVLNALGRFVEGAFMPAMLNIVWIAALGIICFFPGMSVATRITVVCWAILLGGAGQMAFLLRCMAKRGFAFRPAFAAFRQDNVRLVWKNTFIAALGAGAVQVNYMLDQVLAQCAAPWAAGVIGYAERLMDLPLGVIGVAFGTVLLPAFSGFFAHDDIEGARRAFASSVRHLMFAMIPAAAGIFVLAPEMTSVIYEGRAFDSVATVRVSRAVAVYVLGLCFYGLQKSLVPWFQAQMDIRTPLRISVASVILNAVLNVLAVALLPVEWRHVGLAASTVVCALFGCVLFVTAAQRKNGGLGISSVVPDLIVLFALSVAMAAIIFFMKPVVSSLGKYLSLLSLVAIGAAVYIPPAVLVIRRK